MTDLGCPRWPDSGHRSEGVSVDTRHLRPGQPEPSWAGVLPGKPDPFFLARGDGERSILFDGLVTVLLSAAETENRFGMFSLEQPKSPKIVTYSHIHDHETFYVVDGAITVYLEHPDGRQEKRLLEPGDFAYVPAGVTHSYETHADHNKILGTCTTGVERFFRALGELTDERGLPAQPYVPGQEQMVEAFRRYDNIPKLDHRWEV